MKAAVAAAALLCATAAQAPQPQATPCGSADQMIDRLGRFFKERPFVRATHADGSELLLLLSPETRTWTLLVTRDGFACMAMAGTDMTPATRQPGPGIP